MTTKTAHLTDRALLRLSGEDAVSFLHNIVTCDVESLAIGSASFGALLSPQGKVLFDFFVLRTDDGFVLETSKEQRDALMKRLTFYKLRADVMIQPHDDLVVVTWDGVDEDGFEDPRLAALGYRNYATSPPDKNAQADWHRHRIALGVPESERDFGLGDAFPHEVLMDQFDGAGVDFSKGCYVGQEVVSRMQHRGTARSRIVVVRGEADLPSATSTIQADGKTVGSLGSSHDKLGLAIVRLDRAKSAIDRDVALTCEGVNLSMQIPEFVSFDWPQ